MLENKDPESTQNEDDRICEEDEENIQTKAGPSAEKETESNNNSPPTSPCRPTIVPDEGEEIALANLKLDGPLDPKISVVSCPPPNLVPILEGKVLETPLEVDELRSRFSFDVSQVSKNIFPT